jgi:hypothetical protein
MSQVKDVSYLSREKCGLFDRWPLEPVETNFRSVVGNAQLVIWIVCIRRYVKQSRRPLNNFAAVRYSGWNPKYPGGLQIAHQKVHGLSVTGRISPRIGETNPKHTRSYIPPIYLLTMKVPGLGNPTEHDRLAPLSKAFREEIVS